MAITYRASKGTDLTPAEVDANFATLDGRTTAGWADIVAELYTRGGPASPVPTVFRNGIYLYEFQPNDTLEVFSNFHMPHTWKVGSMVYPHIHFTVNTNSSGVVRWGFEYTLANRHDDTGNVVFGATQTITVDFTVGANSAYKHFVCEAPDLGGINASSLDVDGMILMRIYREGAHVNDTFPDSVWGITADLHIEIDKASTPFRAPDFMTGL